MAAPTSQTPGIGSLLGRVAPSNARAGGGGFTPMNPGIAVPQAPQQPQPYQPGGPAAVNPNTPPGAQTDTGTANPPSPGGPEFGYQGPPSPGMGNMPKPPQAPPQPVGDPAVTKYGLFAWTPNQQNGGGGGGMPAPSHGPQQPQQPPLVPGPQPQVMPGQMTGDQMRATMAAQGVQAMQNNPGALAGPWADPNQQNLQAAFGPTNGDVLSAGLDLYNSVADPINDAFDANRDGIPGDGSVTDFVGDTVENFGDGQGIVEDAFNTVDPVVNFFSSILGNSMEDLGGVFQRMNQGWQEGNPPPPGALQMMQDLYGQHGQYQGGPMMDALVQNGLSMMGPEAWEQMAQNRLAAHGEQALSSLNEAERRMRGGAALGGYSASPGLARAYQGYGQAMQDAERNIFNDILGQQMNAYGLASNVGMFDQAQRNALQQQGLGLMGNANMFDAAAAQQNYTGFNDILNAMAGIYGGMVEGAGGIAGGLMGGM